MPHEDAPYCADPPILDTFKEVSRIIHRARIALNTIAEARPDLHLSAMLTAYKMLAHAFTHDEVSAIEHAIGVLKFDDVTNSKANAPLREALMEVAYVVRYMLRSADPFEDRAVVVRKAHAAVMALLDKASEATLPPNRA